MNETIEITEVAEPIRSKPWFRKELFIFVSTSILIAFALVVISIALYTSSGASLLDASKPGFKTVQNEVNQTDTFEAFSSDGPVTKSTLDQFQRLYQKQTKPVTNVNNYDSAALDVQALGIDDPAGANQQ